MTRMSAGGRLERLLAIVPWVVANDGPRIDEIADRFDYPRDRLVADLTQIVFMVGLHPFTPDQLIDVVVDDDRVWIHYADYFARPLRLTAAEALALIAAGRSLLAVPGADSRGPLARGLTKLAAVLGVDLDEVDVDLGRADAEILDRVRAATADHEVLEIEYYAYGRDELTVRSIEPQRVFSDQGNWYVVAHCRTAEGERVFRLDRVRGLEATGEHFDPPEQLPGAAIFDPSPDDPRVTLRLDQSAAWVAATYPTERVDTLPDGSMRVVLAISATGWLERLLLRLGPAAVVEASDDRIDPGLAGHAARRILARYAQAR